MRNAWSNLLLLLGSLTFSVVAIEGVLQIKFLFAKDWANHHALCCEHDPLLGWRHVAGRTTEFFRPEYETTESFNSRGVRGPEYSLRKPSDEYRIVILGDSFTEGYSVEFEELFSEILKRRLNEQAGRRFEVINLGVGGYSTDQELLLYQTEGRKYHPDLTVLMFHDNDIWFNGQARYGPWGRGYKPLFHLEWETLRLTNVPVPPPDPPATPQPADATSTTEKPLRNRLKGALAEHSHLYRWIRRRIKNTASVYNLAIALKVVDAPDTREEKLTPVPKEFGVYRRVYEPEIRAAWELTGALLARLEQETSADGSKLLVFHVPTQATLHLEKWEQMKRNYGLTEDNWSIERVGQELSEILGRLNIEFLNPIEHMRRSANTLARHGKRLHFEYDGHWNRNGHHLVGEMLAAHVLQADAKGDSLPRR
jgi:lysophospholipase L1-like esterase